MDRELNDQLKEEFPTLFYEMYFKDSCLNMGCTCKNGWYHLIHMLSRKIQGYIKEHSEIDFRFTQIKQKFGLLRIYSRGGDEQIRQWVAEVETESGTCCEECGLYENVETDNGSTVCPTCKNGYLKKGIRSTEKLVHFRCKEDKKHKWTITGADLHQKLWYCPHCGMRQTMYSSADEVFDILVECAGANNKDREEFLRFMRDGEREFRFQGVLGFGGKFWNYLGRWYVNCYGEDENEYRLAVIDKTNRKLLELGHD